MLAVASIAPADDKVEKIDAKKLVGKWQEAGKEKDGKGIEFTKVGKLIFTTGGKKDDNMGGSYTIDGKKNKIKVTLKIDKDEIKDIYSVSKLTDTELEFANIESAKQSFTRVKDK